MPLVGTRGVFTSRGFGEFIYLSSGGGGGGVDGTAAIFALGGNSPTTNKYTFAGDLAILGTALTGNTQYGAAISNTTVAIFALGSESITTSKYTFIGDTTASSTNLTDTLDYGSAAGNSTEGIFALGYTLGGATNKWVYSGDTVAAATAFASGSAFQQQGMSTGNASEAVFSFGANTFNTEKYTYVGDIVAVGTSLIATAGLTNNGGAVSNSTEGIFLLGDANSTINKYTYAGDLVTNSSSLVGSFEFGAAAGNSTEGIVARGDYSSGTNKYRYAGDIVTVTTALSGTVASGAASSNGIANVTMFSTLAASSSFTANGSYVVPAGISVLASVSGYGSPATSSSEYTVSITGSVAWVGSPPSNGTSLPATVTIDNYSGPPSVYGASGYTTYSSGPNFSVSVIGVPVALGVGVASVTATYDSAEQPLGDVGVGTTVVVTPGADATAFGHTFPGGSTVGPVPVTTFTNVAVIPTDSYPVVVPTSGDVTVNSNAPFNSVEPSITGTVTIGDVLTCLPGTWVGLTPITFTYQWYRVNSGAIPGATTNTYTIVSGDSGFALMCVVTATNSTSSNTGYTPWTTMIGTGPMNLLAPSITGGAVEGDALSCLPGTWTGTGPITYTYAWYRSSGGGAIGTSSTYYSTSSDVGNNIYCTVTATNVDGSNTRSSNSIGPISAYIPPPSYSVSPTETLNGAHWYLNIANATPFAAVTYDETTTGAGGVPIGTSTGISIGSTDGSGNFSHVDTASWGTNGWYDLTQFYLGGTPVVSITFVNFGGSSSASVSSPAPISSTVSIPGSFASSTVSISGTYQPSGTPFGPTVIGSTDASGAFSGTYGWAWAGNTSANVNLSLDGQNLWSFTITP